MKKKISVRKKVKSESLESVKAVIAFLILLLGLSILLLFKTYQANIVSGSFHLFMVLVVFGMGLLMSLLYLVNRN